ncbi:hypothetical protein POVWA2_043480 [Plasmodium ovale wallikeri]|uniref:Uncharacterized protein n=1 Tax=Plasmodium ovale wallikeri TaxID=864142 RepID=A0A1A8ZEP2_PLAOA|nr:hypothetical protein POVWA1_044900 [Plasmodium ovale wallikeri]SBT42299.1 hypothetical protein POVWA2_043480 [Plasmodium ovale wallikeri]
MDRIYKGAYQQHETGYNDHPQEVRRVVSEGHILQRVRVAMSEGDNFLMHLFFWWILFFFYVQNIGIPKEVKTERSEVEEAGDESPVLKRKGGRFLPDAPLVLGSNSNIN